MRRRPSPPPQKHTAEYVGDAKIRFICLQCGNCTIKRQEIGPGIFKKPMTESAIRFLINFWNKNGGCKMTCSACKKKKVK